MSKTVSVILAAGGSTRMKSKTSKILYPVLGRTFIEWALVQAHKVSEKSVVVVGAQNGEFSEALKGYNPKGKKFDFVVQDPPKGTADAVRKSLPLLNDFDEDLTNVFIMGADAVLLGDESLVKFEKTHRESNAVLSIMTAKLEERAVKGYGRVVRNENGEVQRIVEAKDATAQELSINEINSGFYLCNLSFLKKNLEDISNSNVSNEFYLTDLIEKACQKGLKVQTQEITPDESHGVNTQTQMAEAIEVLKSRINKSWMEKGVRILDPQDTWIDASVELESDVILHTGVHLRGKTRVSQDAVIDAFSIVEDCEVHSGARVLPHSCLRSSVIGENSRIGPFAHIRPGTLVGKNCEIGAYVESKKALLHEGVKAHHLAYLGDCEIGKDANIGAGTITCNYDGFSKHATIVGERAFIGTNTSLVAPIKIGKDSIVGAGSVVTKDIPENAMAVERSDQRNIEQGAQRFRERRKK